METKNIDMKNLIGNVYGRLTVKEFSHKDKKYRTFWKCVCECGNEVTVRIDSLSSGNTKACGCLGRELSEERFIKTITKHGDTGKRIHRIWCNMRDRCSAFGKERGEHYADKGVTVCKEWENYLTFKCWALNNGYSDDLTIDRINVNGNYEPSNCRWATLQEQERNKSNSIFIEYKGVNKHLKDWAEEFHIKYNTLYQRYKVNPDPEHVFFLN
jgi:hypothetical protein